MVGAGPAPPAQWGRTLALWGRTLALWGWRAALRLGVLAAAALLALWVAIFLYGAFYFSYVPAATIDRPVHYVFRTDCDPPGPELCSFPTANVSLLGDNKERVLLYGQLYRVALELEVPESPVNRALGMFLVSITTYGPGGRPIASASRHAMLRYRSPLLRALHTLLCSGLLLCGAAGQSQSLEIELEPRYREDPYTPTAGAVLQIQSKRLQLYSARLRLHAHFSGLRYLLHRFPLSSALLGVAGNFALLSAVLGLGYLQWGRGGPGPRPAPPQERRDRPRPPQEGEAPPPPSREDPEQLGPGSEPPQEKEEEKEGEGQWEEQWGEGQWGEGQEEGKGQEEGEGQEGVAPSPLPPAPPAPPPPRGRSLCSSS